MLNNILRLYGETIEFKTITIFKTDEVFNSGNGIQILGKLSGTKEDKKKVFASVELALQRIEGSYERCFLSEEDGQCFCWRCRQGAGSPEVGECPKNGRFISYRTGSGHGTYTLWEDGSIIIDGSPRSLGDGSEYASVKHF